MAYTALNLITDVLLDMGVIADQETPSASQSAGALVKLNDLIESWNLDTQKVYSATQYIMPFVANQGVYTIGVGGNLNIPRPNEFTSAFVRDTGQTPSQRQDIPLTILNNEEWADIPVKGMVGTFPYAVWFNNTYPLVTAYVTPIPTSAQYSLVFWTNDFSAELALNTVLSLPPGYARAIKAAMYIELAPSYQLEIPQSIVLLATTSKHAVDVHNIQLNELQISRGERYNILSNTTTPIRRI